MERRNELIRVPFLISFSCFRAKILIERERGGEKERRCCSDCRVSFIVFILYRASCRVKYIWAKLIVYNSRWIIIKRA